MYLLEAVGLSKVYGREGRWFTPDAQKVAAVNHLSLRLKPHENLGLVGESGSGKSTLARLLLGLERPSSGRVLYQGTDFTDWSLSEMRRIRDKLQVVFQNSLASFNPLFTVEQIIGELLRNYGMGNARVRRERVAETLELVGLEGRYMYRYPHELSGGQQQRIGIARAIALANDSEFGLTSSLYTRNLNVAMKVIKRLKYGETYINRENFEAMQGFHAGWRKSGIGGADGKHGLNEYLQTHVVYLQYDKSVN